MKMKNQLAEEVLNSDMLHVMKQYKNYFGDKGKVLNGEIELLGNTSKIFS